MHTISAQSKPRVQVRVTCAYYFCTEQGQSASERQLMTQYAHDVCFKQWAECGGGRTFCFPNWTKPDRGRGGFGQHMMGVTGGSIGRASDSRSKGPKFEFHQEHKKNV